MWKLVKRYANGRNKLTITSKVEINQGINYYVVPFYPECRDGSEKKIIEELVKKNWLNCGKVLINKEPKTMIGQCNLAIRELIDFILYVDAYWKTCDFWTQGDPKQDIPFPVKHFLFLVEKMSVVLGDNMLPVNTKEVTEIVFFLESLKFKKSNHKGLW